jgi:hypothetical protein
VKAKIKKCGKFQRKDYGAKIAMKKDMVKFLLGKLDIIH